MATQQHRAPRRRLAPGPEPAVADEEHLDAAARAAGVDAALLARAIAAAAPSVGGHSRAAPGRAGADDARAVAAQTASRLSELLELFDGRYPMALAALHAGIEPVRATGGRPPTAATRAYVAAVLGDDVEHCVPVRVRSRRTGAPVTRHLGADLAHARAARAYNPDLPPERQLQNWTCSIRTATWLVRSIGIEITAGEMQDLMVPNTVGNPLGLLDARGAGLARFLRDRFGLDADFNGAVSWAEARRLSEAGRPVGLGGRVWNHWTALRRFDGGNALLANPSPGWMDVADVMTETDFDRLGTFAAVWITLAGEEGVAYTVANTGGEGAWLRERPTPDAAPLRALAEGTLVRADTGGLAWRRVRDEAGLAGWVADDFLVAESGGYRVDTDGAGLWLRQEPDQVAAELRLLPDDLVLRGDDHAWRRVRVDDVAGWTAADFLAPVRALAFPRG